MSKKTKIILYTVIALVIASIFLLPVFSGSDKSKEAKGKSNAPKQSGPVEVKGKILKFDSFASEIKVMGKIIADEWVDLSPEVAGKIIKINFKEGSFVSKGQLLVKINDADLQAQLKKNEVRLQLAKQNLDRQEKLLQVNGTTKEQYDIAAFDYAAVVADVDLNKAMIEKTEIRAPFSGKIGLRYLSEGAYVAPGTNIATLQSTSRLKIDFSVPQNYSIYLKEGNTVTFTTGTGLDPTQAKIYAIEPGVDVSTATLKVRGYISGNSTKFVPGKVIEVLVSLTAPVKTILIPSETLVPEISGHSVYLYRNGKAFSAPVEIGDRTEKVVQILTGINPGDTLITSGLIQLRKDSPVKLTGIVE